MGRTLTIVAAVLAVVALAVAIGRAGPDEMKDEAAALRHKAEALESQGHAEVAELVAEVAEKLAGMAEEAAERREHCERKVDEVIEELERVERQRNELADSLYGLSETHAGQARANQARMQAMLLPVLVIGIGVFIGTAVSAMFLPMIGMLEGLGM